MRKEGECFWGSVEINIDLLGIPRKEMVGAFLSRVFMVCGRWSSVFHWGRSMRKFSTNAILLSFGED